MQAMPAPRATGTPSSPNSASPIAAATPKAVRVRIAGSDRTYEVRDVLRGMGMRWDRLSHAWHGTLPLARRIEVERDLGLPVQLVRALDSFPSAGVSDSPVSSPAAAPERTPPRRFRDGSRSRLESRLALPSGEDDDSPEAPLGRFTLADVTSGLPDDSREADERAAARHVGDLRGRVKAARTAAARSLGVAAPLLRDPSRLILFCARFGITSGQFLHGAPTPGADNDPDIPSSLGGPLGWMLPPPRGEASALPIGPESGAGMTS